MKQFKYKLSFAAQVKPLITEEKDKYLSIASKSKLKDFLPQNVDFNKKIDFLAFSGEFCTVNRLNANDDGIQTNEAIEIAKLLPYSFIDIEHSRKEVIGVITGAHFNEFGNDKILSEADLKDKTSPFNITISGIIWRLINPDLSEYIEASGDPDSDNHGKIFLSWELLFDKFNLVELDNGKKNIQDGMIISDASEIEKLEKKLKANGGRGITENGKRLGRVPVDEIIPAGCALTENPAGEDLRPITLLKPNIKLIEQDSNADKKGFSDTSTKEAYSDKDKAEQIKNKPVQQEVTNIVKTETKSVEQNTTPKVDPVVNKDLLPKTVNYKFGKCPNCGGVSDYNDFVKTWDKSIGTITCKSCTKASDFISWEFNEDNIWEPKKSADNVAQDKKHTIVAQNENNLSHSQTINVNKDNKTMKISSIKDITDENLKEAKASEVTEFLTSEIKKISDNLTAEKSAQENLVKDTTKKLEETNANFQNTKQDLDNTKKELAELKANLDKINQDLEKSAKLEIFSARMSTLDENFDLSDKEKEILGSKIKGIDKDEDFAKFLEETEVLLAAKKKAKKDMKPTKKNPDPDDDGDDDTTEEGDTDHDFKGKKKKDSKASKEEVKPENKENVLDAAIENGKKEETIIANSTTGAAPSLTDRMKSAFGIENWSSENKRKNRI